MPTKSQQAHYYIGQHGAPLSTITENPNNIVWPNIIKILLTGNFRIIVKNH